MSFTWLGKNSRLCPYSESKINLEQGIAAVEEQLFYINKIVADLQDFAKPSKPQFQEVDVNKTLKEILTSIDIPKEVQVSALVEVGFPELKLDPAHLKRALTNLIVNSLQAMPTGGKLTVNVAIQNGKAMISIADNGEGIMEENKKKIFSPLFTTKAKGQGFGLAVVKRLTEEMGGTVTFESGKSKGTKFTLEFPAPK